MKKLILIKLGIFKFNTNWLPRAYTYTLIAIKMNRILFQLVQRIQSRSIAYNCTTPKVPFLSSFLHPYILTILSFVENYIYLKMFTFIKAVSSTAFNMINAFKDYDAVLWFLSDLRFGRSSPPIIVQWMKLIPVYIYETCCLETKFVPNIFVYDSNTLSDMLFIHFLLLYIVATYLNYIEC